VTVTSAHDLFGVDPAEFVAARDALARELKASGRRDDAVAVKAMRRPSVPTWALNRVARDDAAVVSALLTSAATARSMQERAVEGNADGDALRSALADRRAAVRDVLALAVAVIEASDRTAASQQRQLESTLTAVIASDRLSELLGIGELVDVADDEADDDLASLLGASMPAGTSPRKASVPKPKPKLTVVKQKPASAPSESPQAAKKLAEEAKRAAERRRDALRAVAAAERAARQAAAALDIAQRKADAARTAEDEALRTHEAAVATLDEARTHLDALSD